MRRLAFLSLAAVAAGLAAPVSVLAGDDAPQSRSGAASPHKHFLGSKAKGHICAKCAAAKAAQAGQVPPHPGGMMDGAKIVGCAHSSNGVCTACQALLAMPGEVTMVSPGGTMAPSTAMATAPGRAVASDAAPGRVVVSSGDPEPIGVMQTNYRPNPAPAGAPGAIPAPAGSAMKPGQPGLPAPASRAPFLPQTREGSPHILSHLFGFAAVGRDVRDLSEMKGRRKRETHAATAYGPTAGQVDELPASAVYGNGVR